MRRTFIAMFFWGLFRRGTGFREFDAQHQVSGWSKTPEDGTDRFVSPQIVAKIILRSA